MCVCWTYCMFSGGGVWGLVLFFSCFSYIPVVLPFSLTPKCKPSESLYVPYFPFKAAQRLNAPQCFKRGSFTWHIKRTAGAVTPFILWTILISLPDLIAIFVIWGTVFLLFEDLKSLHPNVQLTEQRGQMWRESLKNSHKYGHILSLLSDRRSSERQSTS